MPDQREAAADICRALHERGYRALFAGGCVRDMLLGVPPRDYDIATDARPNQVARCFPRTVPVGVEYGVQLVVTPQGAFEVTTFRSDGPYLDGRHPDHVEFVGEREDARRRDFTINALFYDPVKDEVVDYVKGRRDLDQKLIRAVGEPHRRFQEDHLRILRGVRFAARLRYAIEPATLSAMEELAHTSVRTSAERVRDEVIKSLTEGAARTAVELADRAGVLRHVLPEVAAMKGVAQPPGFHPEGDVFTHTCIMLDMMEKPTPALALAVLLHDVGKPLTQTFEDRIRFNNHDKVGARETDAILRRLRVPNALRERVVWVVENHMRVAAAPDMKKSKLKRFVRHEGFPELLELCRLDCLSSHRRMDTVEWLREYLGKAEPEALSPPPLLTGRDLIEMGYEPGPLFGEILEALEDAQLEGTVRSGREARDLVRARWPLEKG